MLNVYADFCRDVLNMPVIKGRKTESDKFAGAEATYAIEALMHDGKALQAGTSHYFGDGFARAFNMTFTDKENKLQYVHQTSWGTTTRLIGAVIMSHGDNDGLVLPPKIAPVQVVVLPIAAHNPGVIEKALEVTDRLKAKFRVKCDTSENSAGWKFAEYEMKGVPLRLELGHKDIQNNSCVIVRRDNRQKYVVSLDELETEISRLLDELGQALYDRAAQNIENRTYRCTSIDEIKQALAEHGDGFVKAMWCGSEECEDKVKELTGVGSRCIPFDQEDISDKCVCCGKKAWKMVVWGNAY